MAKVGKKIEGKHKDGQFVEFGVVGVPRSRLRIVVQQNPKGIWYIYKVRPSLVKTVGWSLSKDLAVRKARKYIREVIKCPKK